MKNYKYWIMIFCFFLILVVLWIIFDPFKNKDRRYRIICMGDSLTESEFGYYPRHLSGLLKKKGFQAEVISAAKPGNTSGEYLDDLVSSERWRNFSADAVIIMLGTNDVRIDRDYTPLPRFKHNMQAIIHWVKNKGLQSGSTPEIFLATIPPIFRVDLHTFDESSRRRIPEEIVPAIKQLAREENIHIIDIHDWFLSKPELMSGIHPRRKGYYSLAQYIFKIIVPILERD